MNKNLFSNFNFDLLDSPDFKEDSVREELVSPLLQALGYSANGENKLHRSKSFQHPFVKTGSGKQELKSVPDYLLEANGKYVWVLDAKNPDEEIKTGDNKQQAFFYAIHPEINVEIYALCNGKEFIAFNRNGNTLIYFHLSEIEKYWKELQQTLAAEHFTRILPPPQVACRKTEIRLHFAQAFGGNQKYQKTIGKQTLWSSRIFYKTGVSGCASVYSQFYKT